MARYSSNLALLRFLLSIWVFLAHIVPWWEFHNQKVSLLAQVFDIGEKLQPNGSLHPAVIGFIVLSGYVITAGFPEAKNRVEVLSWGIRRFYRIFPVYLVGIAVGAIVYSMNDENEEVKILLGTQKISFFCISFKILLLQPFITNGYPSCAFQGNAPLVTAAVETVLYFFYGLLLIAGMCKKNFFRYFICLISGWFLLNITLVWRGILQGFSMEYWTHSSPINLLLPWYFGAWLAQTNSRRLLVKSALRFIIPVSLLFAGIMIALFEGSHTAVIRLVALIAYSALFSAIIEVLANVKPISKKVWKMENISYSLYALHAPVAVLCIINGFNLFYVTCITLVLSIISYQLIEKPLRSYGIRVSNSFFRKY